MPADFYDLLEVDKDVSESEIKRAYRDKATRYHPDVNDDPRATDQFATLNKARDVLTDSKERARYDRLGHRDYVSQHLDGLPTMTRPGQNEDDETTDSAAAGESGVAAGAEADSAGDSPEYGPGTGGSGTATNRTRSRSSGTTSRSATSGPDAGGSDNSGAGGSSSSTSSTSSSSQTSTNRTSSAGATSSSSTSTSASTGRSTSASTGRSTGASAGTSSSASTRSSSAGGTSASTRTGQERSTRRSTSPQPSRRHAGLRRGWIATTLGLLLYLAGLGAFASVAGDGVTATLVALQADPVTALAAPSPRADPATVALAALQAVKAGQPTVALLVPVGLVALPLTLTVSVVRFGQGMAYLYGAGVVVPLVWIGARTVVAAPLGADLATLVAVPLLAALWFLVDVGRYLRA